MRADMKPGQPFPDYELPDHTNTRRKLSDLLGNDPMILMLGRGAYCPRDRQQLHQLVAFYPQIEVAYTKLVTITMDTLEQSRELRLGVGRTGHSCMRRRSPPPTA